MQYHYTTRLAARPATIVPTFEFSRFRFYLEAEKAVRFAPRSSANMIRGACGIFLRKTAPPEIYARLFEPGRDLGPAPSGLTDWPRPFVFRTAGMEALAATPNRAFSFDLHLFDTRQPVLPYFEAAFAQWASSGIGPARTPARLLSTKPLGSLCSIGLDPEPSPVDEVTLRFVTPTELKVAGQVAASAEFGILFARLRDRVSTLRALYGPGPLELDFRGMGARAASIRLVRSNLQWEKAQRTSSRTGQTHPLGGFTGEADYCGDLREFLPWLRTARWVGVGRQTVWGKGEVHVVGDMSADFKL